MKIGESGCGSEESESRSLVQIALSAGRGEEGCTC